MRFARWMVAVLVVLGHPAAAEEMLGECAKEMRREPIFEKRERSGLRVLVTRFRGGDVSAEKVGAEAGFNLAQELPEYFRVVLGKKEVQAAGLDPDDLQVAYVPCVLTQHNNARAIGKEWGADLVFWGQASCSLTERECQRMTSVVATEWKKQLATLPPAVVVHGNIVQNVQKGGAGVIGTKTSVTVKIPTNVALRTSVTVVAWHGIEARGAAQELKSAVEVAELDFPRLASSRGVLLFHFALGVYASRAGFHGLAAASFEQAQDEVYAARERLPELNRILGGSYMVAGMPEKGRVALETALVSCSGEDVVCRASAMNDLGWAEAGLGENKKALEHYEQALPLWRRAGEVSGEATTLNNMGGAYDAIGEKKKALEHYEQALPLWRRVGEVSGEARTLNNMGNVYFALGEKKKALGYYEQALPLLRRVGDVSGEATALNNIGGAYDALGEKKKALGYYEQALPLSRRVGDVSGEAKTLNNMGVVYKALGEKKKALEHYEQALPLRRRVGDVSGEATTLNNMGAVYDALGEKKKALGYYEQARSFFIQVNDPWSLAIVLDELGGLLPSLGRPAEAVARFREAATLYLRRPDKDKAVGSLRDAIDVSCKYRLLSDGRMVVDDLRNAGVAEGAIAYSEARLLGHTGAEQSAVEAAWRRALDGAKFLDINTREALERVVRAGLERASRGAAWKGCAGVLVESVVAESPAASLGLHVGDILLRYGEDCLDESSDLMERVARSESGTAISIELWRDGRVVPLQGRGAISGVAIEDF